MYSCVFYLLSFVEFYYIKFFLKKIVIVRESLKGLRYHTLKEIRKIKDFLFSRYINVKYVYF